MSADKLGASSRFDRCDMMGKSSADLLNVEFEVLRENAVVVRLRGEIDISSAGLLVDQFEAIAGREPTSVILDATNVTFMDSTGLHALVEGKRTLHERGSQIFLVPSQQVGRVLELVFPDPLFASRLSTVDEALVAIDQADTE